MVADLRQDAGRQMAMYRGIGQGFGGGLESYEQSRQTAKKQYEKLYLETANERLISVLHEASTFGWDAEKTHAAVIGVNQWAKTKAGERYSFNLQRENMRLDRNAQSPIKQLEYWQKSYNLAQLGDDEDMMAESKRQLNSAMLLINPNYGGVPTPAQAPTEGSDRIAENIQRGANNLFGTTGEVVTKSISATYGKDSEIEAELPKATEPYPNPNQSVRTAVDAMTPQEQATQLSKARQALQEGDLPRPTTKAEHDALRPGDKYLGPDGIVRTKGKKKDNGR